MSRVWLLASAVTVVHVAVRRIVCWCFLPCLPNDSYPNEQVYRQKFETISAPPSQAAVVTTRLDRHSGCAHWMSSPTATPPPAIFAHLPSLMITRQVADDCRCGHPTIAFGPDANFIQNGLFADDWSMKDQRDGRRNERHRMRPAPDGPWRAGSSGRQWVVMASAQWLSSPTRLKA